MRSLLPVTIVIASLVLIASDGAAQAVESTIIIEDPTVVTAVGYDSDTDFNLPPQASPQLVGLYNSMIKSQERFLQTSKELSESLAFDPETATPAQIAQLRQSIQKYSVSMDRIMSAEENFLLQRYQEEGDNGVSVGSTQISTSKMANK